MESTDEDDQLLDASRNKSSKQAARSAFHPNTPGPASKYRNQKFSANSAAKTLAHGRLIARSSAGCESSSPRATDARGESRPGLPRGSAPVRSHSAVRECFRPKDAF